MASTLHKGRQTLPSFPTGPRKAAGAQGKRSDWGLHPPPPGVTETAISIFTMAPCLLPFLPATPWYSGNKHEAKVDTRPEKLWAAVGCGCLILFLRVRGGRGLLSCKARWGRCQPLACCRDEQMDRGPLTVSFFSCLHFFTPSPFLHYSFSPPFRH